MSATLDNALMFDRSLDDLAYDYLGQLLLQKETDALLREIEQEKAEGRTEEMDAFFARQEKKHLKEMSRYFRRMKAQRFFTKTLPGAARVAAIVLALMTVVNGIAIATSSTYRRKVMRLMGEWHTDHILYSITEDREVSFDVPAEWVGGFFPSWMPDGCRIGRVYSFPGSSWVEFVDTETGITAFTFDESGPETAGAVEIGINDAEVSKIEIRGCEADMVRKPDSIYLLWSDGTNMFTVCANNRSLEEALRFADSIQPVEMPVK